MPRNASGVMVLPVGNPVIPGTLIDSSWANPTMADLANEITQSLPRSGAAGMTGPLMLARDGILPKEAVTVDQVNAALTGSNSYLPAGAIQYFAMNSIPTGWLEANGTAVSRTTYANLFSTIGTTYGPGNGTTTFNLPDLRGTFIRGFDNGRSLDPGRVFGSQQGADNASHSHTPYDPGHTHAISAHSHVMYDPGHIHTGVPHTHGVIDPGHVHPVANSMYVEPTTTPELFRLTQGADIPVGAIGGVNAAATGITVAATGADTTVSGTNTYVQPATDVAAAVSGTNVSGNPSGTEARPVNVAMIACIKAFGAMQTDGLGSMAFQSKDAVQITGGTGVFSSLQSTKTPTEPNDVARLADIGGSLAEVFSSDPQVLLVDNTTPSSPILRPQINTANGMVKLNSAGLVPPELLSISDINYQGSWDASPGQTPSQAYPTITFHDGDQYQISVAGTMTVIGPDGAAVPTVCSIGGSVVYVTNSPIFSSVGWYYNPPVSFSGASAVQIASVPAGNLSATNVQAALNELDAEKAPSGAATAAGTSFVPVGGISSNSVQTAIMELDDEKAPSSAATAAGTSNIPAGNIAATNVQAAINELGTEKATTLDVINQLNVYVGAPGGPVDYTASVAGVTAYTDGMTIDVQPGSDCGASPTLNINGLGAKPIYRETASGVYSPVAAGEIKQYHNQRLTYLTYAGGAFYIRGSTAKRYKTITATRNMQAASGAVAYTGLGFKPSKLTAFAAVSGTGPFSIGVSAIGFNECGYYKGAADGFSSAGNVFVAILSTTVGSGQSGQVTSMDADGFTLYWSLNSSPAAGTADLKFLCEE